MQNILTASDSGAAIFMKGRMKNALRELFHFFTRVKIQKGMTT